MYFMFYVKVEISNFKVEISSFKVEISSFKVEISSLTWCTNFLCAACKVVHISEDLRISKSMLSMTLETAYMEVKVKTKLEVYIYIMSALQYMHDNLLKWHSSCWVMHT